MSARKPIVVASGQLQQVQSADHLDTAISLGVVVSKTNDNGGSIVIGTPVYVKSNGAVDKARANAAGTVPVIGLVYETSISTTASGRIQTSGKVVATTGQWDAVTGGSGGLTPGATYYLDAATAGMLTATAPSTVGQYIQEVGVALSSTELKLTLQPLILL